MIRKAESGNARVEVTQFEHSGQSELSGRRGRGETANGHARWLPRSRQRPGESALTRYLLAPAGQERESEALTALEAELAEERERRVTLERQLDDHAGQLAALRDQLATARGSQPRFGSRRRSQPEVRPRDVRVVDLPRADTQADYWLRRCEGFLVEAGRAPIGIVQGVRFGRRHDQPDALVVAAGRWRRRLIVVPVEQIEEISPGTRRIALEADPLGRARASARGDDGAAPLRGLARLLHSLRLDSST